MVWATGAKTVVLCARVKNGLLAPTPHPPSPANSEGWLHTAPSQANFLTKRCGEGETWHALCRGIKNDGTLFSTPISGFGLSAIATLVDDRFPPLFDLEVFALNVDVNFAPKLVPNSRGFVRKPSTRDLASALSCTCAPFISFLSSCLRWDPRDRVTPSEALNHRWILDNKSTTPRLVSRRKAKYVFGKFHQGFLRKTWKFLKITLSFF